MALVPLIEYADASPEVRAVYDDIMAARKTDWINNFWKALDPLTKELIYLAVSVTNNCEYCIHSHTASARKKGMTPAQFAELQSVIGLANEANRLANGYRVPVDPQFANG
ncbi:MAG: carboxymuconolactone decarboxylase family protein [Gemmatimonadales bacterium]